MSKQNLSTYIGEYLDWSLGGRSQARDAVDEEDLACKLKRDGYCDDPYHKYQNALTCPINKQNEATCKATICNNYQFCSLLRKEGYIK